MVIAGLMGGLGNQMFQYACARCVTQKLQTDLLLDHTLLSDRTHRENFTYRNFELGNFNIQAKKASWLTLKTFAPNLWTATGSVKKKYAFRRKLFNHHLYEEKTEFSYDEMISQVKNNTYLHGYFQTEKYFWEIRDLLLQEFSLNHPLDAPNVALLREIENMPSVSVHIRRGDYVNSNFHRSLTFDDYYIPAIKEINKRENNPHFFIFSDEPEFVKAGFASSDINKTIVDINQGNRSYLDLTLMSRCKHNIIANSSFSWWGAWLNPYASKIVIAPAQWFEGKSSDFTADLLPEKWIRI